MIFSLQEYYKKSIKSNEIACDESQKKSIPFFEKLFLTIQKNNKKQKNKNLTLLKKIKNFILRKSYKDFEINNLEEKRGIYLYGSVGRGKTLLMDMFYELIPIDKKIRIHLHHFLLEAQKNIAGTTDIKSISIKNYSENFCKNYDLLCLDEFYVDHIGDAIFIKHLFEHFFKKGLFIVVTSNTEPKNLYKNGISRELFVPFIPKLEKYMDIVSFDGEKDYRTITNNNKQKNNRYLTGNLIKTEKKILSLFNNELKNKNNIIKIGTHHYQAKNILDKIVWFSFSELCEKPCGKKDYIELTKQFNTWIISNVPILRENQFNEAKRFITLIDVLYDYGIKLWISAETIPSLIYTKGKEMQSFKRTVSRIIQMTRGEYKKFNI